jgi:nitrous oxide reductase accessory protein NosL
MRRLLILLLAVPLLFAACGGPSAQEQYAAAVNHAQERYANQMNVLAPQAPSKAVVRQMADQTNQLASSLQSIKKVPEEVQGAHSNLVSAVRSEGVALSHFDSGNTTATEFDAQNKQRATLVQNAIKRLNDELR